MIRKYNFVKIDQLPVQLALYLIKPFGEISNVLHNSNQRRVLWCFYSLFYKPVVCRTEVMVCYLSQNFYGDHTPGMHIAIGKYQMLLRFLICIKYPVTY